MPCATVVIVPSDSMPTRCRLVVGVDSASSSEDSRSADAAALSDNSIPSRLGYTLADVISSRHQLTVRRQNAFSVLGTAKADWGDASMHLARGCRRGDEG